MSRCRKRQITLCYEILKNFGRLLSPGFWKAVFIEVGPWKGIGLGLIILWTFIAGAIRDVISICIVPDYPPKPEKSEVNGVVTYFD